MYSRKAPPRFQNPSAPLTPPTPGASNFTEPRQGANLMPGAVLPPDQSNGGYEQMPHTPAQFQSISHQNAPQQQNGQYQNPSRSSQNLIPPQSTHPLWNPNQQQYNNCHSQTSPPSQSQGTPTGQSSHTDYHEANPVNAQIYRIDGSKKLIEFQSNLVPANLNDYANIHGRGGSKYAPKSTINIVMNDYSGKGTQTGTVTVRYSMEWQDVEILLDRAIKAENGELHPPFGQPRNYGEPWSTYGPFEKNHGHYSSNNDGTVSVFRIEIHYTPFDSNGKLSSYPWFISITNFDAPRIDGKTGTIMHKSSQAKNKRHVFINVSTLEFRRAMVTVSHYIRNWEIAMTVQNIQKGAGLMEQQRKARRTNP